MRSTPSLFTVNGIGFKLYGKSDYAPETDSFMTTHYLTLVYLPLLPIARYRVSSPGGHSYRFLGKGRLRGIDKLHIALFAGALLWLWLSQKLHR
ncbi:MAG TPA: hypothetical protein VFO83_08720 [Aggregicoccus sp.]|nr:hypothetical protein [Aggregicoccus sp.]